MLCPAGELRGRCEQCICKKENEVMTIGEMKHQAMLLTKPEMITAECRIGTERIKPNQGIKAYICDGQVIWQNPDYPDVDYPKATKKNKGLVQMARSLFG